MNRAIHVIAPLVSLAAGLLCAVGISSRYFGMSSTQKTAVNVFDSLDDREQQELRRYAQRYKDDAEMDRLAKLHDAVTRDPELSQKLTKFNEWYATLDRESRNELRPSGEFPGNWDEIVSDKYHRDQMSTDDITIYLDLTPMGLHFTVSEAEYAAFINEIVSESSPRVQAELNGYGSDTAVMLAKCTFISKGLVGGNKEDFRQLFRATDYVYRLFYSQLLNDQYTVDPQTGQEEPLRRIVSEWEEKNRVHSTSLVWRVLHSGMTHFGKKLTEESPRPGETALLSVLTEMTREDQLRMFADVNSARRQLELTALRANEEDQKVTELLDEYEVYVERLEEYRRRMMHRRPSHGGKPRR